MHPVVVLDLVFFLASLLGLLAVLRGWKSAFQHGTKLLLVGLLLFTLFYSFCLTLEWSGITKALDTLEDFVGALIPMWWAFAFYAFFQEMASYDLLQSEERYRQSVENSPNPIFSVDEEGMIQTWNRACAQVFQYSSEEIIGRAYSNLLWNPEDRSTIESLLTQVWHGHSLSSQDVAYRAKDGAQRFTISRLYPILGREGQVSGCVFANTDVTERKRAEEEIRWQALEQETLREAALALTTTLDRDEVIDRILAQLQEVVPYDTASVQLLRANSEMGREDGCLEIVGERGFPNPEEIIGLIFDPAQTNNPNREVVRTRATFIVADAPAVYPEFRREPHAPASIRSWLGAPMLVGDRLIGMLALDKREPRFYTQEHARLAETFAAQAAIAVENSRLFQAEREQRELAEALEQAAAAVSSTLDLDQVLDRILEQVERVVAGDAFNIMLLENGAARIVRWRCDERLGLEDRIGRTTTPPAKYPSLLKMVQTGRPTIILDTALDPDWIPLEGEEWRRSYVAAPIRVKDLTVGFLNVNGTQPGQFGPADARRLEAFASHAATALENARLFEETRQHVAELEMLQQISLQLTSSLDLSAVLDTIVASALAFVRSNDCHIYLYDEAGETFTLGVALWKDGRREAAVTAPRHDGLTATAARKGQPIIINDAAHHPLYTTEEAKHWNVQAIAGFPLKRADRVLGVFTTTFLEPHTFSREEVRVLGLLADQAAIAIENAQLYRRVRNHAEELEQRVQERTAELQAQYAQLEAILHSTTDGIVVVDQEGDIVQANPVAQAWLTQTLSSWDAGRLREAIQDMARQAEALPEMTLELTGVDLELSAALVVEEGVEEPSTAVVDVHDVSQFKALDRAKTSLVTNISHELRTPITTIKLYADLMQRTPPEDEMWSTYLDALVQEAQWQVQLVEDIMQISRIYTGRLMIEPHPTLLEELSGAAVANHRTLAQERSVMLEYCPVKPGLVAPVDAKQITQALNTLVEDAIRYTPTGGRVVVSTGEARMEGRVWATVTVSDTGEKIPAEDLPYIFERFFREEEPRSERVAKTGLRLMIVKGIVESHGGQVTVESEESAGSTFTVWLPLLRRI